MSSPSQPDFEALIAQIEQGAAELRKAIHSYQTIAAADTDLTEAEDLSRQISGT